MKLAALMKTLSTNKDKVTRLNEKCLEQRQKIKQAETRIKNLRGLLTAATWAYDRKIKTHKKLDAMRAEFVFYQQQMEAKKATKPAKPAKPTKQAMADIMACLAALPTEQQQKIIKTMEAKQKEQNK